MLGIRLSRRRRCWATDGRSASTRWAIVALRAVRIGRGAFNSGRYNA